MGHVRQISEGFGNLDTDLTEADLAKLGIVVGSAFTVTHKGTTVTARMGTDYGDVPRGEWVGLLRDGRLRIARNLENAAETLGARAGDELLLKPAPED